MADELSSNVVLEKCRKAGVGFWTGSKAALDLKDELKPSLEDKELNDKIYDVLNNYDREAAERFRNYHSIEIRTSDGELQYFDKAKIVESLLRETQIPRKVAEEIAEDVSEDVRRLQLHDISSSLIREMVNTKLLQRKHINEKREYSRIGLPIYDTKKMIDNGEFSSPSKLTSKFGYRVLREYTLTKALPLELSQEHLKGRIHIHNLGGFITSPISIQNDLSFFYRNGLEIPGLVKTGPAKKPEVAASHAARVLLTSNKYVSGGVALDSFNTYIAPYLEGLKEEEVKQVAQTFLYELNQIYTEGESITVNLDDSIPPSLENEGISYKGKKRDRTYGDYEEEASRFLKVFLETYEEGDYDGRPFKWPRISLKHSGELEIEKLPRDIFLVNQDYGETSSVYGETVNNKKKGVMQTISLNMADYSNEKDYLDKIREEVRSIKKIMKEKKRNVEKREEKFLPFMNRKEGRSTYMDLDDLAYNISAVGLVELAKEATGQDRLNSQVFREMRKSIREVKRESRDKEIDIYLGQKRDEEVMEKFNKKIGHDGLMKLTEASGESVKEMQKYLHGGAFLRTKDPSMIEEDYRFIGYHLGNPRL